MNPLNIGTEWLGIHIAKSCRRCIKELDEMLENDSIDKDYQSINRLNRIPESLGSAESDSTASVQPMMPDSTLDSTSEPTGTREAILEPNNEDANQAPVANLPQYPADWFSKFPEHEIMNQQLEKFIEDFRVLHNIQEWSEPEIQSRLVHFFQTRKFFSRELVTKNEDGTNNYNKLIEHMKLLEYILKFAKSAHSALDYVKMGFVQSESTIERARIAEVDKQYKPKYKEREAAENEANGEKKVKMTAQEKMIQSMVKMGLSRESAESIVFAKKS